MEIVLLAESIPLDVHPLVHVLSSRRDAMRDAS